MKLFSLSQAQKRIWYSQKKHRESPFYNIGGTVTISGAIDLMALKQAIESVYWMNDALRLRFLEKENEILQYISDENFSVDMVDFSCREEPEKAFSDWCEEQASKPFCMTNERLCYFAVFRIHTDSMGYFIKIHHILADGWSIKLLTDQVKTAYEQLIRGEKLNVESKPSYLDCVKWEEQYLTSQECGAAGDYWTRKLNGLPEQKHQRGKIGDTSGNRKTFIIEESKQRKIQEYLKVNHLSLQSFFLCIAYIYEYKVSGAEDIVLGVPLLGRAGRVERHTFGTFTNTMPFRYIVQQNETAHFMMKAVAVSMHSSFRYQKYPYNLLQSELELNRKGIGSLYHACINYYNTEICSEIDGLKATNTEFYNGYQDYSLQIIIRHWNDEKVQLDFDYQRNAYTERQIENMYQMFELLMSQVLEDDGISVKEILLVDCEERERLLFKCNQTGSAYPHTKSVIDLFGEAVKSYPDKVAISKGAEYILYNQLDKLSDRAAMSLLNCGIRPDDKVAMIPEYTIDSIAVILGIMKCGAVYIPIDAKTPMERIRIITEKAGVKYIVTDKEELFIDVMTFRISDMLHGNNSVTEINLSNSKKTVYMFYTSGSTGIPKGVLVTNRNLVNYLCWAAKTYIRKEKEVFPLFTSFAFDLTMTSLLLPLVTGNEIRLYDNREHINILKYIFEEGKATIIKITPSQVPLIDGARSSSQALHTVILGGEDLKTEVCRELAAQYGKDINIYNEYGPTEATIGCMIYRYSREDTGLSVPIGKPIDNVQIYVLDKDRNPLPNNIVGEIYVGGDGVAEGYHESDFEMRRCFVADTIRGEGTLYKTGDLAFRNSDDNLVYCGRVDRQAKVRGYRVELGEIEERILLSGFARQAHVKNIEIHSGTTVLCAYITGMREDDKLKLKKYLSEFLPEYMIPEFFVLLKEFPVNGNGKLDVNNLPSPVQNHVVETVQSGEEYYLLIKTMKEVLSEEVFSTDKNFFELGGDSIKAILVSSRLYEKGYSLSSVDILSHPNLSEMAAFMSKRSIIMCDQGIAEGYVRKTPVVEWFLSRKFVQAGHYNQSMLLEWKQSLSFSFLNEIMLRLIEHHDGLRMNIDKENEQLFYNNEHLNQRDILKIIDCSKKKISLEQIIRHETNPEFNIYKDLLFRPYLILVESKRYIYIILHHLVTDGVSMRILLEDLTKLLLQQAETRNPYLPDKTLSYQKYAEAYNQVYQDLSDKEVSGKFHSNVMLLERMGINSCSYKDTVCDSFTISEEQTVLLNGIANEAYGTKTEELLVAAVVIALSKVLGKAKILVDMESYGRDIVKDLNVNRTIGWFTFIHPVKIELLSEKIDRQLRAVKDQIRIANKRDGMNFGTGGDIRFNYLGEFKEYASDVLAIKRIMADEEVGPENQFDYMVDFNAFVWKGKLHVHVRYAAEIENLLVYIEKELFRILEVCKEESSNRTYTPGDFDLVELTQEELDILLQ